MIPIQTWVRVGGVKTLLFERLADLVLLVHGESEPTDEEWDGYVSMLQDTSRAHGAIRLLVLTDGAGPNVTQRKRISEFEGDLSTTVVTRSRVARGIVTAIGWLGANIKAFPPEQIGDAFRYLDITDEAEQEKILRRLASMRLRIVGGDLDRLETMSRTQLEALINTSLPASS